MLSPAEIAELKTRCPIRKLAVELGATFQAGRNYGDCPLCGSGRKGQTRFEVFPRENGWACAACARGGDAIKLVQEKFGLDFGAAVERLGGGVKIDPAEAARREREGREKRARAEAEAARRREAMRRRNYDVWQAAEPLIGSPAEAYLRARGIGWRLEALSLRCAELAYANGQEVDETGRTVPRVLWRGPAMLAAFVDAAGRFMSLHRTWIDLNNPPKFRPDLRDPATGEKLTAKKMLGHKQGGYLRLCEGESRAVMRVGEGIETTLSVREACRDAVCYRAAGDLGNLVGPAVENLRHPTKTHRNGHPVWVPGPEPEVSGEAMPVPDECRRLTLLEDGDTEAFTLRNAKARGLKRFARPGLRVSWAPSGADRDFNDWLRGVA